MEEKRKSIRISKPLLLKLKDVAGKSQILYISNINQDGICFISHVQLPEGEYVEVSLKLPIRPHEWLDCRCKVLESKDITKLPGAFISGFRNRVKFDSIPEQTATSIKDYCDFAAKQNQKLERTFEELLGVYEQGKEQRSGIRVHKPIVAMYKVLDESDFTDWDITAVRNISTSGAVVMTKIVYKQSTNLQLLLKIPLKPLDWIKFSGKVIESKQLKNPGDLMVGGMYLTRIEFFSVPVENRELLEEYIKWFVSHSKQETGL
ncbi:MAG: PilZ domain-containing protein [Candidatus Omnitrophota bacterium]|nr:PilZ domain-containing protein [Candidatus Omnitrophota bacterium]